MTVLIDNILELSEKALTDLDAFMENIRAHSLSRYLRDGKPDKEIMNRHQFSVHAYAWFATYQLALEQMLNWAGRLNQRGEFAEIDALILQAAFGEYLAQVLGGIAMSQGEIARLSDLDNEKSSAGLRNSSAVSKIVKQGNTAEVRMAIVDYAQQSVFGNRGIDDEMMQMVAAQFHRFSEEKIQPHAQQWHSENLYIPDAVLTELASLGVFGLTIPENYGGSELGKFAMCLVTEELSRGYIGVGSLGTRSEIAADLILNNGTNEQKRQWLPKIASGEIIPTAVFTEPNVGSDLVSLGTRAIKSDDGTYRISGQKTWITHGSRSDLMTLLARTNPEDKGHKGLSMFLAPKQRGSDKELFPNEGMSGSEIEVLGYRGMKEFDISFDEFEVSEEALLGGKEGLGFKQLMSTFESARIQTAARAVGVAQNALETGLNYASERKQFGQPIINFQRVGGKLGWMVVETMIARQLTYAAALEKEAERRCDIEAGMAKLLAARVAWSNADNALQIHGGNGYAEEFPISRILCDARILNIFEGAAEIQAQVIARGLLAR